MHFLIILLLSLYFEAPAAAVNLPLPRPNAVDVGAEIALPRPRPSQHKIPRSPAIAPLISPKSTSKTAAPAPSQPPDKPTARVYQTACPALMTGQVEAKTLPPISEGACQARSPLSVTAVLANGRMVPLSTPITTDCAMAGSLPGWFSAIDGYLGAAENTQLASVLVGTGYMCRNRNNADSGFTSEHGFANALDVTGFTLENGTTIKLPDHWAPATDPGGKLLRFAHNAACTQFTTVLGPEANALHRDHLHLDLGCHGKTCTMRLCQ